jgi:hypothetical protein
MSVACGISGWRMGDVKGRRVNVSMVNAALNSCVGEEEAMA